MHIYPFKVKMNASILIKQSFLFLFYIIKNLKIENCLFKKKRLKNVKSNIVKLRWKIGQIDSK